MHEAVVTAGLGLEQLELEFRMGYRGQDHVRLTAGAVPSVHTAASSGPPSASGTVADRSNNYVTDPPGIHLDQIVDCAP